MIVSPRTVLLLLSLVSASSSSTATSAISTADDAIYVRKRLLQHRKLQLASEAEGAIENQYIIKFAPGTDVNTILQDAAEASQQKQAQKRQNTVATTASAEQILKGMQTSVKYSAEDTTVFNGLSDQNLLVLLDHENVIFAEQDKVLILDTRQSSAPWHLDKIDEPNSAMDSIYDYAQHGANVDVYIIDSGIQTDHSDFGGRASCGFNAFSPTESGCQDVQMHGTHVASIVGGNQYGVAKNANLIAVKVVNANNGDGGSVGTAISGLNYVIQQKQANPDRPAVANVSLGSGASLSFNEAIERTVAAGVIVVNSAGNDNVDACTRSPSSAVTSITVGSIDSSNVRSSFSNYGSCVDIFAPGEKVTAASPALFGTSTLSGTSMSSPVVAGVAALHLELQPSWTPDDVWQAIHNDAVAGLVQDAQDANSNLIVSVDNLNGESDGRSNPGISGTAQCFSGETVINVRGKGEIKMSDLKIGDAVAQIHGGFSEVYSFGHRHETESKTYLRIVTISKTPLEISPLHLIYVQFEGGKTLIRAGELKVGDFLNALDGSPSKILSIETVRRSGVYSPLTTSGNLIVGNVEAASYVSSYWIPNNVSGEALFYLQHAGTAPLRMYCRCIGGCDNESYENHGFSTWVYFWLKLEQWRPLRIVALVLLALMSTSVKGIMFAVAVMVGCWIISVVQTRYTVHNCCRTDWGSLSPSKASHY